jgi:hypothetical protein
MLSPARLSQLLVEFVFLLLGALVVWLGLSGRIYFDRRSVPWLVISVGIAIWGLMALAKPGQFWVPWQKWNRGVSLLLLGVIMLVITRVPFPWVGRLLALAGLVLLVRGALGCLLILKQR